jgi:glycosyltransferase involved in cell wall biosynthesis
MASVEMERPRTTTPLPRRVLHVLNSAGGGAAISTIDLIRSFRERGVDSVAVCHDMGTEAERRRLADVVDGRVLFTPLYWWNRKSRVAAWKRPILELLQLRATGWRRGSARQVVDFARRYDADLIHTNTFTTPEGAHAARTLGVPHVWHVRELVGPGAPYRFAGEGPAMRSYLARHASIVVANSHATAERIRDWVPDATLRTVPNGIDIDRFAAITPRSSVSPADRLVVGMAANLTSWKKHEVFLEVARRVAAATSVAFHIYGYPPPEPKLKALVERLRQDGLADRVRLKGFVADPARIMSEIDILVHPNDHESFGRVLVEAMAAGLPIVSVRGGGAAEIVVDGVTGLLASPDDVAGMANCVLQLSGDQARRASMGDAGRRRAVEVYSLTRCVERMADVYCDAMGLPLSAEGVRSR